MDKMDKIDEVINTGGWDSPLLITLSVSERRAMHVRLLGPVHYRAPSAGLLEGSEARRRADVARLEGAAEIRRQWREDANR